MSQTILTKILYHSDRPASLVRLMELLRERWGRLTCQRIASETSPSSQWGEPSAASLARSSANSFLATPLWAGTQKSATSLSLATISEATLVIALAHCWPGPRASERAHLIADCESEKIVYLRPDSCLAQKILRA